MAKGILIRLKIIQILSIILICLSLISYIQEVNNSNVFASTREEVLVAKKIKPLRKERFFSVYMKTFAEREIYKKRIISSLEIDTQEKNLLIEAKNKWAPIFEKQVKEETEERLRVAEEKRKAEQRKKIENLLWDGTKGDYQAYAWEFFEGYGWDTYDFECLIKLWNRESGWSPSAHNKSSGAHGIPQSLPASKMASEGADYYDNAYTQIKWGVKYIRSRYGAPRNAWAHSEKHNWY